MNNYNPAGAALDWDDEIQYTESSFILLPEGEYPFTVTGFDRQNYDGSEKIPPCRMAVLHLAVDGGDQGVANVDERIYLHTSVMWKLSEFFVSIGQLQKDGSVRMNWPAVPGSTGRLKLSVNKYVSNRDGKERTNNRVEHFLPPEAGQTAPAYQQMAPGQQAANQQPGTYQPPAYQPPAPAPQWQQQQAQQAAAQQTAMPGFQRQGRMGDYQAEKF